MAILFTSTVGVAPGTLTMQLAGPVWNPYQADFVQLRRARLGAVNTQARIRWDIIGIIGGGALIVSMAAGLIANALAK